MLDDSSVQDKRKKPGQVSLPGLFVERDLAWRWAQRKPVSARAITMRWISLVPS
ncbi:MAG: hypothetical protein WAM90_14825 [Rhodanobacter sp.]